MIFERVFENKTFATGIAKKLLFTMLWMNSINVDVYSLVVGCFELTMRAGFVLFNRMFAKFMSG